MQGIINIQRLLKSRLTLGNKNYCSLYLDNLNLYYPKRQETSSQPLFDNVYKYCFIEINKNNKINIPAAQSKELTLLPFFSL